MDMQIIGDVIFVNWYTINGTRYRWMERLMKFAKSNNKKIVCNCDSKVADRIIKKWRDM